MPDTPAPVMPKIKIELSMDPATGQMAIQIPADLTLAAKMLVGGLDHVTDRMIKARAKRRPEIETAGAQLLTALPPVNGKS